MNEGGIATEGLKYRVGKRVSRMVICTSVTLLGLSLLVFLPSTIDELLKNGASFFAILGLFLTLGTFWLGSPSMIAWWRIRPHRKQWDLAATEPPSGLAAHSKQEPTYSRDLVGPAFHFKELETPRTSWLFSAACKTITMGLSLLIGFTTSIAIRSPFHPWLWLTFGVTSVASFLLAPKLMVWNSAFKPTGTIKPCPTPKPFQKDGFHRFHQQQLEAMGMVSLGLYQFPKNSWYESFLSADGCMEVKLGFYKTQKVFNQHWLEITSYLSGQTSQTSHSLDALALVDGNDEFVKQSLLQNVLNQHIEEVSQLCREEELKIATVTQFSLPRVWEYLQTIEKIQTQEQVAKGSQLIWQRFRWLPVLLRKPLFELPTTSSWSENAKPFS